MISRNANSKSINTNTSIPLKKSNNTPQEWFKLSNSIKYDNIQVVLPLQSNKYPSNTISAKDTQQKSFNFLSFEKREKQLANNLLAREVRSNSILSDSSSLQINSRNRGTNGQPFTVRHKNQSSLSFQNSSFEQILDYPSSFPIKSNDDQAKELPKQKQQQAYCQNLSFKNESKLEFEDATKPQSSFSSNKSIFNDGNKISQKSFNFIKQNINVNNQGTKTLISSQFYSYLKDSQWNNIPERRKRSNHSTLSAQRRTKQNSTYENNTSTLCPLAAQRCFSEYSNGKIENKFSREPSLDHKNTIYNKPCNQREASLNKSARILQGIQGSGASKFQRFGTSLSLNNNEKICLKLEGLKDLSKTDLSLEINPAFTTNRKLKKQKYSFPEKQNSSVNTINQVDQISEPNISSSKTRQQTNASQEKLVDPAHQMNSQLSAFRMLQELINLKKHKVNDNFQEDINPTISENYSKKNQESPTRNLIQRSSRKQQLRKLEPLKKQTDQLLALANSESIKEMQMDSNICKIYKRSFFPTSKLIVEEKESQSLLPELTPQNLQPLVIVSSENVLKSISYLNKEKHFNHHEEVIKEIVIGTDQFPKKSPKTAEHNQQILKQNQFLECLSSEEEKEDLSFQLLNSYFESKYKGTAIPNFPILSESKCQKESDCRSTQLLFDSFDPWEKIDVSSRHDYSEEINKISDYP